MSVRLAVAVFVLAVVASPTVARAAAIAVPDTPAGRVLQAWLDAFDSGDAAKIAAYCKKYAPEDDAEGWLDFYQHTGGVDLVAVDKSERLHIEFRVKDRGTPITGLGKIDVDDGPTPRVANFGLRPIPPGVTVADMHVPVDAAVRARVVAGVGAKLDEYYVYPELAKKMGAAIRANLDKGAYAAITDGDDFAARLTKDLQAVSHDKHLHVVCQPRPVPKDDPKAEEPPMDAETRARLERDNCGFVKVEKLESNVGYVKFNFFGPPDVCGPTVTAAIGFLAHVDAIIFDLRGNGGGAPEMVAFIASYLFGERTHLNDIYDRKANETTTYFTKPDVPGKKLTGKPAFVLTSKRTFSAAEDFTYALKNTKRATIVGETTGGGAHPVRPARADEHFVVGVPFARSISPITKGDWEGTGVVPDVKVAADEALSTALKLAVEQIRKQEPRAR
jgi:retinol-binding protein 3